MFLHPHKILLLGLSVSIIRVHSTQGMCSFPPAQTQRCWSRLTLTSLCSALNRKAAAITSALQTFYTLSSTSIWFYILPLWSHFPPANTFSACSLWHPLYLSLNAHVCAHLCAFSMYFYMWLYVCISLAIVSFLLHWKAVNIPISSGTQRQLWLQTVRVWW